MAMGAEEVHRRVQWDLILGIHRETSIKTRQAEPSMEGIERDGHANGWIAIDIVMLIHQAMITARTADLHWKDPLIGGDIHPVKPDFCSMDDVLDLLERDVGKIVAIDHHDGPKGASPETVHRFEGDLLVWCGLPGLNPELSLERLCNA
jgi:hypothetical protein